MRQRTLNVIIIKVKFKFEFSPYCAYKGELKEVPVDTTKMFSAVGKQKFGRVSVVVGGWGLSLGGLQDCLCKTSAGGMEESAYRLGRVSAGRSVTGQDGGPMGGLLTGGTL